MNISVTMQAEEMIAMLGRVATGLKPAIVLGLSTVSELIAEEMGRRAPVGVGAVRGIQLAHLFSQPSFKGGLQGSIGFTLVPDTLTSEIKPSAPYADDVELGTGPHWVSVKPGSPLEQWAQLHDLNPYAIQRSIAEKGTNPHPYIVPTYEEMGPTAPGTVNEVISAFLQGAQRGGL